MDWPGIEGLMKESDSAVFDFAAIAAAMKGREGEARPRDEAPPSKALAVQAPRKPEPVMFDSGNDLPMPGDPPAKAVAEFKAAMDNGYGTDGAPLLVLAFNKEARRRAWELSERWGVEIRNSMLALPGDPTSLGRDHLGEERAIGDPLYPGQAQIQEHDKTPFTAETAARVRKIRDAMGAMAADARSRLPRGAPRPLCASPADLKPDDEVGDYVVTRIDKIYNGADFELAVTFRPVKRL